MPNQWGTAQGVPAAVLLSSNAAAAPGPGLWGTVASYQLAGVAQLLVAPSPGLFECVIMGSFAMLTGAAAPTGLQVAAAIVSGTPIAANPMQVAAFAAATTYNIPYFFVIPASAILWAAPGSTPLIQVNAATTGVTVQINGNQGYAFLRAVGN